MIRKFFKRRENLPASFKAHHAHYQKLETLVLAQEGVEFHCTLTEARARNMALQAASHELRPHREISVPHIVHVGLTTYCNLRCPACPTGNSGLGRAAEHLKLEAYERMLDEIGDRLMMLLFWDWGEPLMHPRICDFISRASRQDIFSLISTNGLVACSEKQLDRLIGSGLSYIIVCVDGATQESYEKYRIGGVLSRVLKTIERLVKLRGESAYPVIEFRSLATRYNENEFPALLRMAQDTGADIFSVKSLRPYDYRGHDVDGELAPMTDRFARYRYGEAGRRDASSRNWEKGPLRCAKPLFAPTLNSDGQLAFCSYVQDEADFFGDLNERKFSEIWNDPETLARKANYLENGGVAACDSCYFRSDHLPTMLYTVALNAMPDTIRLQNPITPQAFLVEYEKIMAETA
jgi:MoaA/NifB/PqqE/SkfB family radical SAM enzyme